jgi:hypothetical protein
MRGKTEAILKRRGLPFAAVDHLVIDDERVTAPALLVYVLLCRHANYNTGVAFPSVSRMQARLKVRRQTVTKAILDLKALRYLTLERRQGMVNLYTVGPELSTTSSASEPVQNDHPFRVGTGVVPPGNGTSSASEHERYSSSETHKEIPGVPPSQEKKVDRTAAQEGLLGVLAALPGGAQRVAEIRQRQEA